MRWGGALSVPFGMTNGIRQGSLISPLLFNVYIDEMSGSLSESNVGCHVGGSPLAGALSDSIAHF